MADKFILSDLNSDHLFIQDIKKYLEKTVKQKIIILNFSKVVMQQGVAVRAVEITFEEGQVLTLVFRKDGDVIKTKLNNRTIPLIRVMDYDDLKGFYNGLDALALKVKGNQEKFNIKRRATRVVIPRVAKPSVKKRIAETRAYLEELKKINADKQALKEQKQKELVELMG